MIEILLGIFFLALITIIMIVIYIVVYFAVDFMKATKDFPPLEKIIPRGMLDEVKEKKSKRKKEELDEHDMSYYA